MSYKGYTIDRLDGMSTWFLWEGQEVLQAGSLRMCVEHLLRKEEQDGQVESVRGTGEEIGDLRSQGKAASA